MLLYKGGATVAKGTYWNPADGRRVDLKAEGALPGDADTNYLKLPPGGIIVIAPVFGLMYVLFLPLFGIGTFLMMWFFAVMGSMAAVVMSAVKVTSGILGRNSGFGWSPSAAYLAGRRAKGARKDNPGNNPETPKAPSDPKAPGKDA